MAGRPGVQEEFFVPFDPPRDQIRPPVSIRSTLIASSLRSMRDRGLWEPYLARLEPKWRVAITESVAGVWLPIEAGVAHYRACDGLPLSSAQHVAIGREVGERVHGTLIGMLVKTAKSAGATPWTAFAQAGRLYARLFDGGGVAVVKAGPKDARWEIVLNPLARYGYFRDGARGMWESAAELFCAKVYVTEIGRTDSSLKLRISWA